MTARNDLGWYGKLPTAGDFLLRRLTETQSAWWSDWIRAGLINWPEYHDSAPLSAAPMWNFVLPATLGMQRVQLGCLVPSRDRVGRVWPLLALQSLPISAWRAGQLALTGEWYQSVGKILHQAVAEHHSAEWLDSALMGIAPVPQPDPQQSAIMEVIGYEDLPTTLTWQEVARRFDPLRYTSYWWTHQGDGYPLMTHSHSGKLTAQLFAQLFHPVSGAQPRRNGLYPPMFE